MITDLSQLLQSWPFEPGKIKVRRILGHDGREKIQMRLDLGILQMESQGRPDGDRPFGHKSLYDYYMAQRERYVRDHGSVEGFALTTEDCADIRLESLQYYYRYLSYYYLNDYAGVQRDTQRNLQVFDFVKTYAQQESDKYLLEQYRPYVIMMYSRAKASQQLEQQSPQAAIDTIVEGIEQIQQFFDNMGQTSMTEECDEINILRKIAEEIVQNITQDPLSDLRREMRSAVAQEDYERAAVLRDEIRRLEGSRTKI